MKRSIGRDYRKQIEKRLQMAESVEDLMFIVTNFDSSLLKLSFVKALQKMKTYPKKWVVKLPNKMKTKDGQEVTFEEEKNIEFQFDCLPIVKEEVLIYARVEIPRAVHRCVDVSELSFFLGEDGR